MKIWLKAVASVLLHIVLYAIIICVALFILFTVDYLMDTFPTEFFAGCGCAVLIAFFVLGVVIKHHDIIESQKMVSGCPKEDYLEKYKCFLCNQEFIVSARVSLSTIVGGESIKCPYCGSSDTKMIASNNDDASLEEKSCCLSIISEESDETV